MRRALCVGIDEYPSDQLNGCVSDASHMMQVLSAHDDGAPNFDCRSLVAPIGCPDDVVTRPLLREAIEDLFRDKADVALLHFSGHGTVNNLDGYLVTQDARKYDEGVAMNEVLRLANESPVSEIVIFLDCCYSGRLGNVPAIRNNDALLREGVSILTASRGEQPSVGWQGGGLFTSLVSDALASGAADILGEVTAPSVYSYVEAALGAWYQRPLFKAHLAQLTPLRRCAPPIERAVLRKLPALFPLPAEELQLDPSYERTSSSANTDCVSIFSDLQQLNRVHLVIPCGCAHMYDAALQSKSCQLTHSGRYYWRLAENARI